MTTETQETTNDLIFNEGTIGFNTRGDKYSTDVKRSFPIEEPVTGFKVNIKWETIVELAELAKENDVQSILIRNGWEASGQMSAGAGIALKSEKKEEFYHCTFLESEMGKPFDKDKIQRRSHVKLRREHLEALFTFLRFNAETEVAKAEAAKIKRTTLDLG